MAAGDVASLILSQGELDETTFQDLVHPLVRTSQAAGVAAVIDGDSRIAGRVGADGLHLGQDLAEIEQAIHKFSPAMMIGAGNVKTRHNALSIGELQPDYVMFGRPGGDIRPQPHPKNLALGQWWSAMVEIPCIVLAGNTLDSIIDVARCGAEFVALGSAIFAPEVDAKTFPHAPQKVQEANKLLDQHAPRFEPVED